jgi:predicted transposase YdaD
MACEDGEDFLLHIEFQSSNDKGMPERLLEYSFRAKMEYDKPICSCVIFLRKDGIVPEPPLRWTWRKGKKILIFDYLCLKLWEMTREELLAFNQPALLPLALLTKDGASRTIVTEMFESLLEHKLYDLLPVGQTLAALTLKKDDLDWLERTYQKMTDILKDSPAYQWMTRDAREDGRVEGLEEGRKEGRVEGREKEREEAVEQFRQAVIAVVSHRFPKRVRFTKKLVHLCHDMERLQKLVVNLSIAQNEADAEDYLLSFSEEEDASVG